ncbi:MAG: hypothetical protein AB8C13_10765 [Phycisphaerales bacterium]
MTDRRPGPPLFELLRQDQPDPDDQQDGRQDHGADTEPAESARSESARSVTARSDAAQPQTTRPASETSPDRAPISAGVSRAERSAATMPDEPMPNEGGVVLSMPRVYMLIAIIAILLVLVWAGAYKAGFGDGKREMESLIPENSLVMPPNTGGEAVNNPESQPVESGLNASSINSSTNPVPSERVGQPPRVPARSATTVMTAQGFTEQDPRQTGYNYLQLATLSTEQAANAVVFMNENGIQIIGVPVVDSGVRAGNNPSRYTLYSLGLAVPGGGEFRAMQSQRTAHTREIARLGTQWQRERRGGSDFAESKTQWVKYN